MELLMQNIFSNVLDKINSPANTFKIMDDSDTINNDTKTVIENSKCNDIAPSEVDLIASDEKINPLMKGDSRNDLNIRDNNFSSMQLKNIKLPTISLPKFSGDYNNWLEFKNTFESVIHSSNDLNDIMKYYFKRIH